RRLLPIKNPRSRGDFASGVSGSAAWKRESFGPSAKWLVDFVQVDVEDRHVEDIGLVAVFVVHVNEPDRFIADEHLDGIIQLGPGPNVDVLVVEFQLQEFLQLDDLGMVHWKCPAGWR